MFTFTGAIGTTSNTLAFLLSDVFRTMFKHAVLCKLPLKLRPYDAIQICLLLLLLFLISLYENRFFALWKQVKDQEATTLDTVQCIQQTVTALQKVTALHYIHVQFLVLPNMASFL